MIGPICISDILKTDDQFSILLKAIKIAEGLSPDQELPCDFLNQSDSKQFTIFAPTNKAFKKLQPEVIDYLFQNRDEIRAILLGKIGILIISRYIRNWITEFKITVENIKNLQISK